MSRAQSLDWDGSDALDNRLARPSTFRFPEGWTVSESWQRAQNGGDRGGPCNAAEREKVEWV